MKAKIRDFVNLPFWTASADKLAAHALAEQGNGRSLSIVTLNAEMVLHALDHQEAAQAILGADVVVADSTAIAWWLRLHGRRAPRIPGVDLAGELIARAAARRRTICVLGGSSDYSHERAVERVRAQGVPVVLHARMPEPLRYEHEAHADKLIAQVAAARPDIVFVGFGHGVQEWVIARARAGASHAFVGIGVGGTIEFWSGEARRAPRFMRMLGLEWLWRLLMEPRRWKRIIRAVIIFPARVAWDFLVY